MSKLKNKNWFQVISQQSPIRLHYRKRAFVGAVVTEIKYLYQIKYQTLIDLNAKNNHSSDTVNTEVSATKSTVCLVLQPSGDKYYI